MSQFPTGRDVELLLETLAIAMHGLGAELERGRDLPSLSPAADLLEDFQFTIGERLDQRFGLVRFSRGRSLKQSLGELRAEKQLAVEHTTNRFEDRA